MSLSVRSLRARKWWFAAAAMLPGMAVAACSCCLYLTSWTAADLSAQLAVVSAALKAQLSSIAGQIQINNGLLSSALKISAKQVQLSGDKQARAHQAGAEAYAAGLASLSSSARIKEARLLFGADTGQGVDACGVLESGRWLTESMAQADRERGQLVREEVYAGPGNYADPLRVRQQQLAAYRDKFCTPDQVEAGLCAQVGSMPGAAINAAVLFQGAARGTPAHEAKQAFINQLAGEPDRPIKSPGARTAEADAYWLHKAQRDATLSPALNSLKHLQQESTLDAGGKSFASLVQQRVGRYFGGEEHEQWAKALAIQSERGLLVELVKIKSFDLAVLERQYRQQERMEADLAALLAQEARRTPGWMPSGAQLPAVAP